jgi:hypothetical protein
LVLYCARLVDDKATAGPGIAQTAGLLLEILTPIAKSWPSEWCLNANDLAIQVHGGYGYTRDYPVEQLWRDNRLNMIHEGTHGIQAQDLLGRKVRMQGGAAFEALAACMNETIERARGDGIVPARADELAAALQALQEATAAAWGTPDPELTLANATPYLQAFGHVVVAWLWLDIGVAATTALRSGRHGVDADQLRGKLQCLEYFFVYELPKISAWLGVVAALKTTCLDMREEWFAP